MSAAGCSCRRRQHDYCLPKHVPLVPVETPHPVLIGTDLSRSVDARLFFMNGARDRIATLEETNARNEVGVAPFLNAEDS